MLTRALGESLPCVAVHEKWLLKFSSVEASMQGETRFLILNSTIKSLTQTVPVFEMVLYSVLGVVMLLAAFTWVIVAKKRVVYSERALREL